MKPFLLFLFLLFVATHLYAEDKIERIQIVHNGDMPSLNQLIIERSDLEDNATLLSDILAQFPGIQIRKVSGFGNPAQVSIRGSNSQQVNVYIDGQLINSGQSGSFDLDQLPISLIESIEINQSQSSGTGPTPIGGEIRITTIKPTGNSTSAYATLGSVEQIEVNVKHQVEKQDQRFLASIHWLEAANNFTVLIPQPFINSQVEQRQTLNNNQFSKLTAFITHDLEHAFGVNNINLQLDKQTKHIPNYQNNTPENHTSISSTKWRLGNIQTWNSPIPQLQKISVDFTLMKQLEQYHYAPSPQIDDQHEYDSAQFFTAIKLPFKFDAFDWQPYVQFDKQMFEANNFVNKTRENCNGLSQCDIQATLTNIHLGQKTIWRHKTKPWQINWSINKTFSANQNIKLNSVDAQKIENSEQHTSSELDWHYQWLKHRISLQYSLGFRAPNMYELFGDRGSFKGNGNLAPERSKTLSISTQHNFGNWVVHQSVYKQTMQDSIVAIFNASGTGSYQNVSNVDFVGWSSNGNWTLNQNWQFGFTLDYIDSNTKSEFRSFNNKHQPGIYHQEYQSYLQWQPTANWSTRLSHYYGRQLYYDRANKVTSDNGLTSEKNSTDFSLSYEQQNYKISTQFRNLFNQSYRDLSNKPAQGRQIQFTFTIKEF